MANTTNFGWETPDDTDLVKDGAAAIRTLGSAIDTSLVDLKGGTTGQVLSKASNTDMDFTWTTSSADITEVNAGVGISGGGTSGAVTITNSMATAIDAKGDLVAGTGADTFARLAVGANNTVLVADSSTATGLKWGSASAMTQIASQTVSAVSSVTFSSIASGYKELALYWFDVTTSGTSGSDEFQLRLNNDSSTNYNWQRAGINGTTADMSSTADRNTMAFAFSSNSEPNSGFAFIINPDSTARRFFRSENATQSGTTRSHQTYMGYYKGGSAITEFNVVRTAGSGTFSGTFQLYGLV